MDSLTDEQLMAQLQQGQTLALDHLYHRYAKKLYTFCHYTTHSQNRQDSEDLVQDVFYRVLESPTVPESFRAWIYRICRNRCLDVLRSRGRRRDDGTLPSGSHLGARVTGQLTGLVRGERWGHLRRVVEELPADQREVLHLRYAEGLSRAEIAEVLELDEKLVKSRLFHAMEKLRVHDSLAEGS